MPEGTLLKLNLSFADQIKFFYKDNGSKIYIPFVKYKSDSYLLKNIDFDVVGYLYVEYKQKNDVYQQKKLSFRILRNNFTKKVKLNSIVCEDEQTLKFMFTMPITGLGNNIELLITDRDTNKVIQSDIADNFEYLDDRMMQGFVNVNINDLTDSDVLNQSTNQLLSSPESDVDSFSLDNVAESSKKFNVDLRLNISGMH